MVNNLVIVIRLADGGHLSWNESLIIIDMLHAVGLKSEAAL